MVLGQMPDVRATSGIAEEIIPAAQFLDAAFVHSISAFSCSARCFRAFSCGRVLGNRAEAGAGEATPPAAASAPAASAAAATAATAASTAATVSATGVSGGGCTRASSRASSGHGAGALWSCSVSSRHDVLLVEWVVRAETAPISVMSICP